MIEHVDILNKTLHPFNRPEPGAGIKKEGTKTMGDLLKVIEILGESTKSWEDAAQTAIDQASKSLKQIRSIYIKNFEAKVEDGKTIAYRINAKISFLLDDR